MGKNLDTDLSNEILNIQKIQATKQNKQERLHQTEQLLHGKGDSHHNKRAAFGLGEIIYKMCMWQKLI